MWVGILMINDPQNYKLYWNSSRDPKGISCGASAELNLRLKWDTKILSYLWVPRNFTWIKINSKPTTASKTDKQAQQNHPSEQRIRAVTGFLLDFPLNVFCSDVGSCCNFRCHRRLLCTFCCIIYLMPCLLPLYLGHCIVARLIICLEFAMVLLLYVVLSCGS